MNKIDKVKATLINNLKIFKEKESFKNFSILIMSVYGENLAKSIKICKYLNIDAYSIIKEYSNYPEKQINELFEHWEEEWRKNPQLF